MTRFSVLPKRILDLLRILVTGQIISELKELNKRRQNVVESFQIRRCIKGNELVSVVVPTRNEELCLPFLLRSLSKSWYKPIEVIVVDYSSSDRTVEIAKSFGAKVVCVRKGGIGYASHIGVIESRGEIVIRTDADAIFPPDLIMNVVTVFREDKCVKLHHIGHLYWDSNILVNLIGQLYDKYWRSLWKVTGHFMAFRREIYEIVGGFDPNKKVGEDFDFGSRVFKKFRITYSPDMVVLVSSRRIKASGFMNYILGQRRR